MQKCHVFIADVFIIPTEKSVHNVKGALTVFTDTFLQKTDRENFTHEFSCYRLALSLLKSCRYRIATELPMFHSVIVDVI